MARAETITLLPQDRYATIMHLGNGNCHFNQVEGGKVPMRSGCDDVWDQPEREELAWTIATAEEMIAAELGFWPAPKWIVGEEHRIGRVRSDWANAEFKTKYAANETYLGFGFHWKRLHIDTYTAPELFLDGFNFISGGDVDMNFRISAVYEMM